mmetsp:Transcript_35877/g.86346  ORF Transcript_35877/g.86346 Transcript_35877/m.86346 type:complete len:321 (-) Transcript_35877:34-996(-)
MAPRPSRRAAATKPKKAKVSAAKAPKATKVAKATKAKAPKAKATKATKKAQATKAKTTKAKATRAERAAGAAKAVTKSAAKARTVVPTPAQKALLAELQAVVINLDGRMDRWLACEKKLHSKVPGLRVDRLSATDGRVAAIETNLVTGSWHTRQLATYCPWYKPVGLKMSGGERGCAHSHLRCWELAQKLRKPLVVFEDDAVPLPGFVPQLAAAWKEAAGRYDIIFLTSKDRFTPKKIPGCKAIVSPAFAWTTVGYIVTPAGANKLLTMLPVDQPVDNFLAIAICEGRLKACSMRPSVVRQANTWNVGSDVPHSDDVAHW